jgi:hypothetical protein
MHEHELRVSALGHAESPPNARCAGLGVWYEAKFDFRHFEFLRGTDTIRLDAQEDMTSCTLDRWPQAVDTSFPGPAIESHQAASESVRWGR